ncbi:hypothetical protein H4S08_003724 [Coemansia sp. RSA 1365]|nr:hypothetical protein H4S08_003724 [Coemansia sp. RSA 1365]
MKVSLFALAFAISVVSVYPGSAIDVKPSRSHDISLFPEWADRGPMVYETFRMPLMFQRKVDKIDPANPVAAAATDPNEAAMKIKSRDLVPTDRPGIRPDLHHHRHSDHDRDDDDADNNGEDETDSKANSRSKNSGNRKSKEDEDSESDDSDDSDSKSSKKLKGDGDGKTKGKKDQNESEKNNKSKNKDNDKNTKDSKSSKNGKKAHIGLDGKKVDDEDSEKSEAIRKNNLRVNHVKARQRKWRTGKPKYNYRQALEGWKEVGPMYYYKGKYENSANSLHNIAPVIMAAILCAFLNF